MRDWLAFCNGLVSHYFIPESELRISAGMVIHVQSILRFLFRTGKVIDVFVGQDGLAT